VAEIGIRELKIKASEIVRTVREKRSRYIITHRGRPVAALVPIEEINPETIDASISPGEVWDELVRLGEEIGKGWRSAQTGTEILSEMRAQES
jgi:prevent-host-death family protein